MIKQSLLIISFLMLVACSVKAESKIETCGAYSSIPKFFRLAILRVEITDNLRTLGASEKIIECSGNIQGLKEVDTVILKLCDYGIPLQEAAENVITIHVDMCDEETR